MPTSVIVLDAAHSVQEGCPGGSPEETRHFVGVDQMSSLSGFHSVTGPESLLKFITENCTLIRRPASTSMFPERSKYPGGKLLLPPA